jgi:hypothetical protein
MHRCDINLEATNPAFNEGSLLDDLGRFRGTSSFTGMHRTYAGASVLVATKPAELTPALRLLEVPATCNIATERTLQCGCVRPAHVTALVLMPTRTAT